MRWLSRPVVALASLFLSLIVVETGLALTQRPAIAMAHPEVASPRVEQGQLLLQKIDDFIFAL